MWTACCCWLLLAFVETNPRRLQVLYLDSDNLPLLDPGFMFDWDAFKVKRSRLLARLCRREPA